MRRPQFALLNLVFWLVAALSGFQSGLAAQSSGATERHALTLTEVIQTANANYPAIKAAQSRQRAAQGAIAVAKTAYLPRTDLLWQANRATANNILGLLLPQSTIPSVTGQVLPSDPTRSAWNSAGGALISWQPFDFGARSARVEFARNGSEAAKQEASLTSLVITANAGSAFFDLAAAQQLVTVDQANVKRLESFDRAVHVLVNNTLRPGADASQADAQLAIARNQLVQTQTQEALRRSALAEYLQTAQGQLQIDMAQLLAALPPADLDATTVSSHPAVLQEHALVLQQQAQKRVLDRSYVPVFSASGMVFGRGAGTSATGQFPGGTAGLGTDVLNWGVGAQVTFSAFDFFNLRDQKKVQEANIQVEQAKYDQSLSDVTAAVEQARATLSGARQIAANTPVELSAAQASEQQQQARYRSGLATVVDVAAAESTLAQAEGDVAIACLSVWRAELGVAAAEGDLQPFLELLQSQAKGN